MEYNNIDSQELNQDKDQETFQIEDLSSNHKWRTETPNIILDIGLNCYEGWLYVQIKRIAADGGQCTCSNNTLMAKTKMGLTKLKECKKSLQDKGLIRITERKNSDNSNKPSLIQIADMWEKNFIHFQKIKEEKNSKRGSRTATPPQSYSDRPQSYSDHKEEHIKEELYIKKEVASNDAQSLSRYLFKKLKELREKRPIPNWTKWDKEFSELMRIKEISLKEVICLIDYATDINNKFVVESPDSLRRKYEKIADHMAIDKKNKEIKEVAKKDPRTAKTIDIINEYISHINNGNLPNQLSFILKPDGGVYQTVEKRFYPRAYDKFIDALKIKNVPESLLSRIKSGVLGL